MTGNGALSILQVCSASRSVYGAVHSMMTLARAQAVAGHRVEFVTRSGKRFGDEVRSLGYRVHEVPIRTKIDPLAVMRIRRLIRRGAFDVVHTHLSTSSVNGTLAARVARVPGVATVHGLSGKLSFLAAHHLIAVSEQVKRHLVEQGFPGQRISVVYNGIEPPSSLPTRAEARQAIGLDGPGPVLGTVARVTAAKGIQFALEAVATLVRDLPGLRYIVVGDGDSLESCRTLAAKLGIEPNVVFAGYRADVMTYLAAMDVMLFPSLQEAMGISIVESFLAGTPVVGTEVGGIPEVVTPETGILVPPSDASALARGARRLLESPDLRDSMAILARRRAETVFGLDTMASRTEHVYRALMGESLRLPLEAGSIAGIGARLEAGAP